MHVIVKDLSPADTKRKLVAELEPTFLSAWKETCELFTAKGISNYESVGAIVCVFAQGRLWTAAVGKKSKAVLSRNHGVVEFTADAEVDYRNKQISHNICFTNLL